MSPREAGSEKLPQTVGGKPDVAAEVVKIEKSGSQQQENWKNINK